MCGTGYRTCAICINAGGCLAGMRDDFFYPATKEQVEMRLKNGEYSANSNIMKEYLDFIENNKDYEKMIKEFLYEDL